MKLKTYTVEMPKAADVPGIRKELGLSQPEFAGFMGVSLGTVRNWEQSGANRKAPHAPCFSLPQNTLPRYARLSRLQSLRCALARTGARGSIYPRHRRAPSA